MPAPGPHPRSHDIGASIQIDALERATHKHELSRLAFKGSAMDVLHRVEQESEPISIARCRELLGEEADMMSDEDVLAVAHHAETLANILIAVAMQDVRVH
jgi:hypothetical protein